MSEEYVNPFPLCEKDIENELNGKKIRFRIKELRGVEADKITNEAKNMKVDEKGKTSIELDLSKFNEKRILTSVINVKIGKKEGGYEEYKIGKLLPDLPRKIYNWLVMEIDNFNRLGGDDEKNSEPELEVN